MDLINPPKVSKPNGTYSHAIKVPAGFETLYVSGQVPLSLDGTVPEDFAEQAEMVFKNIQEILIYAESSVQQIVKLTSFITKPEFFSRFAEVRAHFLDGHRPASTLLVVSALASPKFLVEVEAVAVINTVSQFAQSQ